MITKIKDYINCGVQLIHSSKLSPINLNVEMSFIYL